MKHDNHPELYAKSNIAQVCTKRKEDAKRFYHESKSQNDVALIDRRYEEWSGLTLRDVLMVFQDGDWLLGGSKYYYGGPKWATIVETTLDLREVILNKDWKHVPQLVEEIKGLHHNNGLIVEKFRDLCQ